MSKVILKCPKSFQRWGACQVSKLVLNVAILYRTKERQWSLVMVILHWSFDHVRCIKHNAQNITMKLQYILDIPETRLSSNWSSQRCNPCFGNCNEIVIIKKATPVKILIMIITPLKAMKLLFLGKGYSNDWSENTGIDKIRPPPPHSPIWANCGFGDKSA